MALEPRLLWLICDPASGSGMLLRRRSGRSRLLEQVYFHNRQFSHEPGGTSLSLKKMRPASLSYADPDCFAITAAKNNLWRDTS
jgi:hypothetical protein